MTSDEVRAAFLSFFEEKGHKIIPGSSLIPQGDPTLLLTSAGMVQFKPYFLGEALPPNPRLASCQKCFRTTDIESVGDPSHLTFFEMLGNFSIGDYFKQEAINWAWEFVTQHLGLSPERLWITIFLDDEEAFHFWRGVGVPEQRILRFGEQDNFWGPAGDSGPCGPCSEIHYDFGEEVGCGKASCAPNCDCGRFSEIWNLVFTQYNQDKDGHRTLLPKPNIDTGMGLERTAAVVQDKTSVYETDLFIPLLECISELAGKKYGSDDSADNTMRVIAEHSRGIAFLIGDGVIPSNEGRGYVLRRLLRRSLLFGRRLGVDKPLLAETVKTTIEQMGHIYPELVQRREFIIKVIELEEERFRETLTTGLELLDGIMQEAATKRRISGQQAFKLYDTYGFPIELTQEIAAENGFSIDSEGFEKEMEKQRERARTARKFEVGSMVLQRTLIKMREELRDESFPKFKDAFKDAISKRRIAGSDSLTSGIDNAIIDFRGKLPDLHYTWVVGRRDVIKETQRPIDDGLEELEQAISDYKGSEPRAFTAKKVELGIIFEDIEKSVETFITTISGLEAFELHRTYDLPVELINEIAVKSGLSVDLEGFEKEMEKQRERVRATKDFTAAIAPVVALNVPHIPKTGFVGYDSLEYKSTIVGLMVDNESVGTIIGGQEADLILETTPFYGEMGGQVGDTGQIRSPSGNFVVTNTIRVPPDIIVHQGYVAAGALSIGDDVEAIVDEERRLDIARNHTATHLLQSALRQVLGEHVRQRGSVVAPDRLRFDFSHLAAMTREEIQEVQHIVNEKIRQNLTVYDEEVPYKKAIEEGAIALFDEKYGDTVRVMKIGEPAISSELCGGTHVTSTGEIGFLHIIGESSIGAGLRRIEALTGRGAEAFVDRRFLDLEEIAQSLDTELDSVSDKAHSLSIELKNERRQRLALERELSKIRAESLLSQAEVVNGVTLLVAKVPSSRLEILREMSDIIRDKLKSVVVVLGTIYENRPVFLAAVTPDLVAKGYDASKIVKEVAKVTGGSGGGKPSLAQAGGKDKAKLDEALRLVKSLII